MRHHSIKYKITGLITLLIIAVVLLCWVMNKGFLANYYQYNKVKNLGDTYRDIQTVYKIAEKGIQNATSEAQLTDVIEDKNLSLERLESNRNINIYVIDKYMELTYFNRIGIQTSLDYPEQLNYDDQKRELVNDNIAVYLTGIKDKDSSIKRLSKSDKFSIFKVYDQRLQTNNLELCGKLDKGYIVYLRTNFESMQESVSIANKFLGYIGLIGILLGIIVTLFVSNSITKPIKQLSGIAKKMAELQFGVKYQITTKDEIGELGYSINTLSEKLEETITELKNANNELKSDLQDKIQIDEMRKEFLSNVTHELKTPIALIQGYAEGLVDNVNSDEESRNFYCDVIIDEAAKMNNMVKRLLSLNQIEFGNNTINIERFDIGELIKGVLTSADILIKKKKAIVQFDDHQRIAVWADESLIEEVFTNYISNALNHLDNENIIDIRLTTMEDKVRVSVFNTGKPIPEQDIDKIWIKFYKVDKARTREYGGNGIGLSIVRAIMTSHNKECGVINHSNGVEFWFELDTKN